MVPLNPQRGLIRCKLISNETVTPRIGSGRSQGFTDFPFIHREGWKEREGRDARESETKWRARNSVKREGERQREGEPGSSIDRLLSSSVPATEPVGSSCSWNLLLPFSYVRLPLSLSLSLSLLSVLLLAAVRRSRARYASLLSLSAWPWWTLDISYCASSSEKPRCPSMLVNACLIANDVWSHPQTGGDGMSKKGMEKKGRGKKERG